MNVLSLDIGGTALKSAVVDSNHQIQNFKELPSNAIQGKEFLMETIFKVIQTFENYQAIGISVGGQTNYKTGVMLEATASFPDFNGTPLKAILEEQFHVPVAVDNDVNCVAIAEGLWGAAKGEQDYLCLTYGTGVGGGIVIDGKVYHGSAFCAGEFGHMLLHAGEKRCPCGAKGCYEAYASVTALVKSVQEQLGIQKNGREICQDAETDPQMKTILDGWIDEVVLGLVSLCHIFNPPCIVIGGGIMENTYVAGSIAKKLPAIVMQNFRSVEVKPALLGNHAGLLGASYNARKLL